MIKKLLIFLLLCSTAFGQYLPPQQKPMLGMQINHSISLSNDIVGCWLMNEGAGGKVYDLSGNGYHLTASGGPTWQGGKYGPATKYVTGSTQYFQRDECPVSVLPYTVSAWVKCGENNPAVFSCFFYIGKSGDAADYFVLAFQTDGQIRGWDRNSGAQAETANDYADDAWHHVVALVTPTAQIRIDLYVDGDYRVDHTGASSDVTSTYNRIAFGMARDVSPSFAYTGLIDNVMIWNRALTASEIQQLYIEPFGMFKNPFDWYWYGGIGAPAVGAGQVIFINMN